ncbi:hypothetical protein I6F07_33085 [Ensifer sp. IC4062]|nr:hypothetical protein [Ensifer sp. IC4062]
MGCSSRSRSFTFAGPIAFTNPGDQISFTLIVDADNPAEPGLSGPYSTGISHTIVIDRATVDAALPGANGVVQDYYDMQDVLSVALAGKNAYAGFVYDRDTPDHTRPNMFTIYNNSSSPLNGSSFEIRDLTSTVGGFGGLTNVSVIYGPRASNIELTFEKFKIYKDVALTFDFSVNNQPAQTYSIDRTIVNGVLGTTDGWVNTAEDMFALLQSVVTWPDLEFTVVSPSKIKIDLPASVDRNAGYGTNLQITSLAVNVEPLPELGVLQIDIEAYPDRVYDYLHSVDGMLSRLTDGAATLGALARRIGLQQDFVTTLVGTIEKGVGLLVDTNMEQSSAHAKALQAQEQLSLQALSIANDNAANIAQLFR